MPAQRKNSAHPHRVGRPGGHARPTWLTDIDPRELATGALVAAMALVGSKLSPQLFARANDLVVTQAVFELPMALLAVCAGKALREPTHGWRAAYVIAGLVVVAAGGTYTALDLGAPAAIAGGVSLLVARATPPRGVSWFSAEHCRAIEVTAGTAWACLVGAFLLLFLLAGLGQQSGQAASSWVYALTWGGYYLALGLLLPWARRRFGALPPAVPTARSRE